MFSRIDTKFLIQLRNLFNELTEFFITFIDPYGNFIIPEVGKRKFCSYLRKLKLNNLCDNSNTFWVKKAVKSKKPFIYKCPFGLTEIVVPIIVENKCIGCVVTGQVRTKNDSFTIPSDITLLSQEYIMLKKMYNEVPILSCQTINAVKNFINHIINYIFEVDFESLKSSFLSSDKLNKFEKNVVNNIKRYIERNLSNKKITLTKISEDLSLPPYYISHLFKESTGHSISHYIVLLKVKKALQLLRDPSLSIKQIVNLCGFYDEHYFNKLFKKEFKISPGQFRRSLSK